MLRFAQHDTYSFARSTPMSVISPLTVMIVAGERSGDVYGGRLAAALRARRPDLALFGCGGEAMREGGVETVADASQFAMVGISEVLSGLPGAYRAFQSLARAAARRRPRLTILIDSPSLNMRLARRLKGLGIPVVYFVSPQIWAWKKWRLRQLPALVDRMLCIFDFEEEIYRKAGIPADYIGHPLVDTVAPRLSRNEFFARYGLDPELPTVALLPGSREIEIDYILPPLLGAIRKLSERRGVQFLLAAAPALNAARLRARLQKQLQPKHRVQVATDAAYDALAHSTVAVVASGTATVEAALLGRPMVVVYRVSPFTAFFARRMVDVPFFSMVNLLAGKKVVDELIQDDLTAPRLAAAVAALLDHPELQSKMKEELSKVQCRLGEGGAIERAAAIVL
ncbi:MAG: lipid-A-disaccharide synthase, partial [Terriglobia bacterium]